MEQPFEVLSHTADLRIRVYGASLAELFRHALLGMFQSASPTWGEGAVVHRPIVVGATDRNALLVDFLSEALGLSDINNESYTDIEIQKFSDTELRGTLLGQPIKRFTLEIKAVTHHRLEIQEKNGRWEAEIVFDI